MLKKYLDSKPFRYVIVGGASYVVELIVLFFLLEALGFHRTMATGISFWFSIITSFSLQKVFVFADKDRGIRRLTRQGSLFFGLVMFNYIFTLLVVSVFDEKYILYSRTAALLVVTLWNFFIYKRYVFSDTDVLRRSFEMKSLLLNVALFIKKHWIVFIMLSMPVVFFNAHYLFGGGKIIDGDFDYYAQMYEAFRISVLDFGQFPSWNPWMSGGMPLFANPQFGLISIQSPLVLLFGTVYGLKLAYFTYALVGFWGMFLLCRKRFGADMFRSAMLGYVWVMCGFFVGHNISHFTFSSFYLLPLVLLSLYHWRSRWGWLSLGILMSVIVLSSLHYAFLIISLSMAIFIAQSILTRLATGNKDYKTNLDFIRFLSKSGLLFGLLAGYRVVTTYLFVQSNSRPSAIFGEPSPGLAVNIKALFLPIGSILPAPKTQYGWGEYSAYMGLGVSVILICMIFVACKWILHRLINRNIFCLDKVSLLRLPIVLLALTAFALSLGDFGIFSPFNLLRKLPGFSETRVSSRWLIIVVFSVLLLIASIRLKKRTINLLLAGSVLELMLFFGPLSQFGHSGTSLPEAEFNPVFSQFDNGKVHLGLEKQNQRSYYYATSRNIGNIYADDSIINTLNNVLGTSKCGLNVKPSCDLVLTDNADISFWSPNKIVLKRTGNGPIRLNMNRERGWLVNGVYIFLDKSNLDPSLEFKIPDGEDTEYIVTYAPKLSPEWLMSKIR